MAVMMMTVKSLLMMSWVGPSLSQSPSMVPIQSCSKPNIQSKLDSEKSKQLFCDDSHGSKGNEDDHESGPRDSWVTNNISDRILTLENHILKALLINQVLRIQTRTATCRKSCLPTRSAGGQQRLDCVVEIKRRGSQRKTAKDCPVTIEQS